MSESDDGQRADAVFDVYRRVRIDQDNAAYYRAALERRLVVNRCDDCGHWHQPPRPLCPKCWSWSITATEISGEGEVALVTVLHQGPPRPGVDYSEGHAVIAVDLDEQEGLRIAGGVVGTPATEVGLGDRVSVVWSDFDDVPPRPDFEVVK